MELGSIRFDYGTVNYGPNERIAPHDEFKCERLFLIKIPDFIKILKKSSKKGGGVKNNALDKT